MATTVTVTRSPDDDNIGVRIDQQVLTFQNGTASIAVEAGRHTLEYVAALTPGTNVSLAITAPPNAAWSRTQPVDGSGLLAGFQDFDV
jgi:hypothetical protein